MVSASSSYSTRLEILLATYLVLPEGVQMEIWHGFEDSCFDTREKAEADLQKRRALGERPQLIRWQDGEPKRLTLLPSPAAPERGRLL